MASRADNFNRADSSSSINSPSDGGGNYTLYNGGTWGISSNRGYGVSGGQSVAALASSAADVQVDAAIPVVGTDYGLIARLSDNDNYWLLAIFATSWVVYRKEAGGFNNDGSASVTVNNGDTVRFEGNGTSIKAYHNGTQKISITSSFNQSATKHGLRSNGDAVARFDDLAITDLAPAAGQPAARRLGLAAFCRPAEVGREGVMVA